MPQRATGKKKVEIKIVYTSGTKNVEIEIVYTSGTKKSKSESSGTHAGALSVEKLKLKGKLKREIEKGNLKGTNRRGI